MARAINWARYDRLTAQGHSERDIAAALGIPRTTLRRAIEQRQGPPAPVQTPGQPSDTGAVQRVDTGAEQGFDTAAVPRLDRLEAEVQRLITRVQSLMDRLEHPPGPTPVQISTLPPYPKGKAVRWNLWILDAIREEIASLAAARDLSPSQLVQEVLWKALSERRSSTS
jgi:Homeodomain-like domain